MYPPFVQEDTYGNNKQNTGIVPCTVNELQPICFRKRPKLTTSFTPLEEIVGGRGLEVSEAVFQPGGVVKKG